MIWQLKVNGELIRYFCTGKIELECAKSALRDKLTELGGNDLEIEIVKGDGFIDFRTSLKDCLNPS